jgi:hypothetical protein
MGEREELEVASMAAKGQGIFDLAELYQNMKSWLDYNGFGDQTKSFREEKYVERQQGDVKQLEIRWKAEKFINSYVSWVIGISFFVVGLKKVEIEKEGKKIGINKGSIVIKFKASVVLNRQGKWGDFLKYVYDKFIIRERISETQGDLYGKIYSLYNEVKNYLDMNSS